MSTPIWAGGRVGRIEAGRHSGMYVQVEEDESRAGFHIWLLEGHPDEGPSKGWDIWADSHAEVEEWFIRELQQVDWLE